MHQGSDLGSLLPVIVTETIARYFWVGFPWELLYADNDFVC